MFLASLPANEAARLKSLHELQALDTEPEEQFDALVKVASLVCGVPIALISLVDVDRVWFKANVGLPGASEMPRDTSFCTPTIFSKTISEVCDATLDPRFFDNPQVTAAPHIRFYAGAPIRLSSGECVGSLCVIDRQPRQLDAQQRDILTQLAFVAARALEGRRALVAERRLLEEQARAAELLRESQALLDRTGRMAGIGGWSLDLASKAVTCSDETCRILGVEEGYRLTLEEAIGFYAPEARPVIQAAVEKCMASGQGWDLELPRIQADGRRTWTRTIGRIDLSDGVPVRLVGALQDVTESRAQRQAVVDAKERIEAATQSGEIGIWDLDLVTGALTWDARMYQFYGVDSHEQTASYILWAQHLHPEDRASAEQAFQDALSGLHPFDTRFRIIWGDGTVRHLRATGRVTRDNEGRALRIVGVNWDISKVRELSLELERKEQMLRSVTDSLPMLVSYIDTEQRYRFANPTYAAWFGVPIENIVGRRVADILDASTWAKSAPHLQAALQGTASVYENQLRVLGQQRELRAQFMPQWDEHGQVEGVVGVVSDITEYKDNEQRLAQAVAQATETLRQEEARWRDFSTIASDWFWETDAQHSYRFVSDNFEQFYGLPACHLVGKNLKSLLENDSLNIPELTAQHVLKLDGRQPWRQFEYQVCIADGSSRWIVMSASPQFDTEGRFTGYRGNGSCITERKQVEKKTVMLADEISMLNQRFKLAKDAARIGVWDHNFATSKLIWSKWMYAHYAVRQEDFGGTFEDWLARLHPGDAARVDAEMAQAVRGEKDFDTEFRVVWPIGEVRHIKAAALVQRDGRGAALKMVGVNYDITAMRLAEQAALRDQELDLDTVQRIGRIGTFVANLDTEMWTSSAVLDEILGIDANFVRSQNNWSILVVPESAQAMVDYLAQVVRGEESFDKEYEIVRPSDGQRRWLHGMGEITSDAEGKPLRFKGTVQDITERKLAQAHLKLLEASISHLNDMVVITEAGLLDEPGPHIVFVNAAFERHTGYSLAEVLGRTPRLLQGPLTQRLELDRICAALRAWQPVRTELINYTKAGQPFWVEIEIVPMADAMGVFTHWVSVQRDINERKRAEHALADSAAENARLMQEVSQLNVGLDRQIAERTEALARQEALFHALADQAPQVIWMLDLTGNVTYINQAWLDLVGGTLQDWTGGQWIAAIYPEDWASLRAIWLLAQAGGQPFSGIRRVLCQDGSVHTMSYRGTPVRDERGVVIFWVGIDSDVTELKLIETALRERNQELASSERALRELASRQMAIKEVERQRIAQEIHDELGQRLTVLRMDVAMLPRTVQASGSLPVPLSVGLLKDQIDEILAVVRDLAGKLRPTAIDLGLSVAAEALIENFQASLGIPCALSDQLPASLALGEPRTLGAFRILQESLTNAARHAHAGSIHITLMLLDDQLLLRVHDDGRGFAVSAQHGQPGFGLTGMRERATALGGRVDVASRPGHGTTVEARFPLHCPLQSAIVLPPGYDPLDLVPLL